MVLNDVIPDMASAVATLIADEWGLSVVPEIDVVYDQKRIDHSLEGHTDTIYVSQAGPIRDDGAIDIGYNAFSKHWELVIHTRTSTSRARLNELQNEVRRIIMEFRRGVSAQPASAAPYIEYLTENDLSRQTVGLYRIDTYIVAHSLFGKIDAP